MNQNKNKGTNVRNIKVRNLSNNETNYIKYYWISTQIKRHKVTEMVKE